MALRPLTNLAALLAREPALASRITRLTGAMLFGHGPVFRDLGAVLDPQAVWLVLVSGIPVVLTPFKAARQVLMTGSISPCRVRWCTDATPQLA